MPYRDPSQQKTYSREWFRKRRADYLAGKSCKQCGSIYRLEIHHREPAKKLDHKIWSWTAARRRAELAKCDVLCHACHKLITRATAVPAKQSVVGYRGVRFNPKPNLKKPYRAEISILGRSTSLGYFATPQEAGMAYDRKARELYGSLAVTNFPASKERAA